MPKLRETPDFLRLIAEMLGCFFSGLGELARFCLVSPVRRVMRFIRGK